MAIETGPAPANPTRRILGMTGQAAGVVGIVACVLAIVGVLLLRGWVVGQIDGLTTRVDEALGRGVPILDAVSTRVDGINETVSTIVDAAEAIAGNPNPAPGLGEALTGRLAGFSERYVDLRTSYGEARAQLVATFERIDTLDQMLPGIDLPGPPAALEELDARLRALDASVMELLSTNPLARPINEIAAAVAERVGAIEASVTDVAERIDAAEATLADVRAEVAEKGDQAKLLVTIVTVVAIVALAYAILLHVVLFQWSAAQRRESGAAAPPPPAAA